MGNKLSVSPFPTYEAASSQYNAAEMSQLKEKFSNLSDGRSTISLQSMVKAATGMSPFAHRQICPRIFNVLDIKKDGAIDFEEYICAITVFRSVSLEEKAKCVFLMYEGAKNAGSMSKENFTKLVLEAGLCTQFNNTSLGTLDQWLVEMKGLSQAVAEAGFLQYAAHLNKMELAEFLYFAKNDSTVRSFFPVITALLEGTQQA